MAVGDLTTNFTNALAGSDATVAVNDLTVSDDATVTGTFSQSGAYSTESDFAVNTDKFTVAAATGDTAVAGTFAVTGASTFTGAVDFKGGITCDTSALVVADTTGIITMKNGAILDNNTSSTVLNITETTVRVTGAFDVTGGFTTDTNAFAIADTTGIITMKEGATIDNDTGTNTLTLTETTITLVGAVGITGALDVTGGFTTDTNGFAVADTTGIVTMKNGATLDNNTSASILNITEGTVRVTGAFDVTGGLTTDTNALAIADTTGVITMKGGATLDNNASADILNITETTVRVTGILDVTGNSTLASADIGGGFTSGTGSGLTVAATGALSTNGAIIGESSITSGNNGANGHAGTLTVNDGANPGAASFAVAGATGIITLHEGATIDNDTGTNTLTLTETTITLVGAVGVTGALDVTGGFSTDTNAFAIADTTGIITMKDGATIDNDTGTTTLTVTSTTISLVGTTGITGALDVTGGFTTDTNAFAIADTTGVITMKGGATIDNNDSSTVLKLTETTIQVAGILDVTGNSTLVSLDVGGGAGSSGATITAAGIATFDGLVNANGGIAVDTDAFTVANTTGIVTLTNGAIIDNSTSATVLNLTETTVRVTGALDVTGGFTTDTNALAIADTTGVITMKNGATIDNNAAADTITIAETNIGLTGVVTVTGALHHTGAVTTASGVGTAETGVVATEYGVGGIHQTLLTLTLTGDNDVDVADGSKTTGTLLYTLPEGFTYLVGVVCDISDTTNAAYNADANDIYYIGIGTADGTQAADADLTGTEQDLIAKATIQTDSSGANTQLTNAVKGSLSTPAVYDGHTTAVPVYLNIAVPDASNTGATTHAVTGTVTLSYITLGDYT